jgi:hypothetical protein
MRAEDFRPGGKGRQLFEFLKGQIANLAKKQCGKTPSFDPITMRVCLAICAKSHKAYDYLRRLLELPSHRTLSNIFRAYSHGPGLHANVFEHCWDELRRHGLKPGIQPCTGCLQFDEVGM